MDRVNLLNLNNETINVTVIRYFELNSNRYFIYSLNEIDAQNYVKLYISKINATNEGMVSANITDETEWNAVKEEIKNIVRDNKSGVATVKDLDFNELNSLQIKESRAFKLSNQLVLLLSANKNVEEESEQPIDIQPTPSMSVGMQPNVGASIEPQTIDPLAGFGLEQQSSTSSVGLEEPAVQPVQPTIEKQAVQPTNIQTGFEMPQATEIPNLNVQPIAEENEYKKLYEEEVEKTKQLNEEIEILKSKIENIKNILNV